MSNQPLTRVRGIHSSSAQRRGVIGSMLGPTELYLKTLKVVPSVAMLDARHYEYEYGE